MGKKHQEFDVIKEKYEKLVQLIIKTGKEVGVEVTIPEEIIKVFSDELNLYN